jgi:hypothetical protein
MTPRAAFDRADEVFVAKVLSVERKDEFRDDVTLQVSSVLKGERSKRRTLVHNRGLGCQYSPPVDMVRLFFVNRIDDGSYSIVSLSEGDADQLASQLPSPVWNAD